MEGDPKDVKAEEGALQGEGSKESVCSHLRGRVGNVRVPLKFQDEFLTMLITSALLNQFLTVVWKCL